MSGALLVLFVGLLSSVNLLADGVYRSVWRDIDRQEHDLAKQALIIVVAQGNRCPIFRQNIETLNRLAHEFRSSGVSFFAVNGLSQDSIADIREERREYHIQIPIVRDAQQAILKRFGLATVGEVVVFRAKDEKVLYRGSVDDRVSFDLSLPEAKHHFLRDALTEILSGKTVSRPSTPVLGCAISVRR